MKCVGQILGQFFFNYVDMDVKEYVVLLYMDKY